MTKKQSATVLENDGERMIPEYHKGGLIYAEHLTRYQAAQKISANKIVLDIACGSGYGTKLLAQKAKQVYGVDIDADSVAYAKQNYGAKNIDYRVGDGESIPLPDDSVDLVITFETIEHVKDYKRFVKEVKRILKADGLVIVSTPNDLEFAEGNHFHLHEFEEQELTTMLRQEFAVIDPYYQATWKYVALGAADIFNSEGPIDIKTLNLAPLKPQQYLYFYLLCSNRPITEKIESIAAAGEHYSERANQRTYQEYLKLQSEHTNLTTAHNDFVKSHNKLAAAHNKLAADFTETKNRSQGLQTEIQQIKSSHAYQLATNLAKVKRKLKKPTKSN